MLIDRSGYDREGFSAHYDRFRPRPPQALLDVLCRYARTDRPELVVDLGCGTGLSTRAWSGTAARIVGVEPNPAMLAAAEPAPGVEFREAFAAETGLDDGCADIVTCSQSLHWMEPEPTLAEVSAHPPERRSVRRLRLRLAARRRPRGRRGFPVVPGASWRVCEGRG